MTHTGCKHGGRSGVLVEGVVVTRSTEVDRVADAHTHTHTFTHTKVKGGLDSKGV